ncbi:unnamed protein product [Effrenium voratum]|uniref:Uncharacterized protein n=1 Tax=Effrenium voratum TaxID=2562239 RepID=A0AA36J3F9_9DINO|nr:unnamed protein product [Effrenium voratum]
MHHGVKKENFQRLKVQIGVAREKVKDLQRRKLREEHEKEVAAMKEALTEKVEALLQRVQKAEESLQKVEEEAKVFKQGKDMKSLEMVKLADDLDVQIKAERESLEALKKDIAGVREGVDAEILSWFTAQARPVETKFKFLEPRLSALTTGSARFRESAKGKSRLELQQIEQSAEAMLRWHQKAKSLTPDEVADAFGGDAVTEE